MRPITTIDSDWSRWPNFSPAELMCKGSGQLRIHPGFMEELQALRDVMCQRLGQARAPMIITSGCRSAAHNASVGGHPRSLHICDVPQHDGQMGTLAVDVAVPSGTYRGELFARAWGRGWSIGWGGRRNFVHLDLRRLIGLPQESFDY